MTILLKNGFGISEDIMKISEYAEKIIEEKIRDFNYIKEYNQLKVIQAMQENKVSDSHFAGSTGYGYDDRGREVLDAVYARVFRAEDALVRHQIVSGTHALALCMFGNLTPGNEMLSITGKPYDTLEETIGIRGDGRGSLKECGITYKQVDLTEDGGFDFNEIKRAIGRKTKLIYIQRSRGYSHRPAVRFKQLEEVIKLIRDIDKNVIILVDNCYGEFVEEKEPIEAGADLVAGSLIKNPGGGLAISGGYIAGRETCVKGAAYRLTAPGLGKKVGATQGSSRLFFQGLFLAPHVVAESVRGAVFCAALMKELGFQTAPDYMEERGDIIQAICFNNPESLIAFCQGIQKGSPVDAFVTPQPWDMPGYDCPVIMAAGGFVQGASIELSADAPLKPPYTAYMQGGLVYESVKLGVLTAVQLMSDRKLLKIH